MTPTKIVSIGAYVSRLMDVSVKDFKYRTLRYFGIIYRQLVRFIESSFFVKLIFVWFLIQSVYIAFSTSFGIPPDEVYHFSLIKLFASNGWLPFLHNENGYYFLGEVTKTPFFFYHYLLSLPFHIFGSSSHAFTILRLVNIGFAVCSLLLMTRIALQLNVSRLVKNLSLFMMTNTLMFVFLSASVNYDNLFILFTLASITLLLNLIDKFSLGQFLLLLNVLVFGLLVKSSFMPIAFIVVLVILIKYRFGLFACIRSPQYWALRKYLNGVLVVVFLLGSILFVQRYIVNVVSYHALSPSCTKVHTLSQCSQNAVFVRDATMSHNHAPATLDNLNYLSQWSTLMLNWTFGILGHNKIEPTHLISAWSKVLFIFVLVATVRMYNPKEKKLSTVLGVVLFYTAVLIYTNHGSYVNSGLVFLAVQGRYIFGVLPIIYILGNYYIFKLLGKDYLKFAYISLTLVVYLSAGLPSYIVATDSSWHTRYTTKINEKMRNFIVETRQLLP